MKRDDCRTRRAVLGALGTSTLASAGGCLRLAQSETTDAGAGSGGTGADEPSDGGSTASATERGTDADVAFQELTLTPAWEVEPYVRGAAVLDGAFAVGQGRRFRLYTPEGTTTWESAPVANGYRISLRGRRAGGGASADGSRVYVATGRTDAPNARVYAFDRETGAEQWYDGTASNGDRTGVDFVTLLDDVVAYGADSSGSGDDQDPVVRAVDRTTGEVAWVDESITGQFLVGGTAHDGRLFVAGFNELFVYDAGGSVVDSLGGDPSSGPTFRPGFEGVTRAGARLYGFDYWDETIKAVDLDAVAVEREVSTDRAPATPLAVDSGGVYFGTEAGYLVAYDLNGGTKRWETRVEGGIDRPLVVDGGRVWACDSTGTVSAISAADGTVLAAEPLFDGEAGLAVLDDHLLSTRSSTAYAVETV